MAISHGVEIRQIVPDDETSLPNFFSRVYGEENLRYRYPERWRWLCLNNPFIPSHFGLPAWIALCGGEIVGYIGAMFVPCQIAGSKCIELWAVDLVVSPQHRGKGIASRLMKTVMEAHEVFLALTMVPESRHMIRKHGGKEGPKAEVYVHVRKIERKRLFTAARGRLAQKSGPTAAKYAWGAITATGGPWLFAKACEFSLKARQRRKMTPRTPLTTNMSRVDGRFGREADELWESFGQRFDLAIVRGRDYLNWKYLDQPGTRYECFYGAREGKIRGLVIFRMGLSPEPRVGVIADVIWADRDDGIVVDLLKFALDSLYRENAIGVYSASSVPVVVDALERLGFLHVANEALCMYSRTGLTNRLGENAQVLLSKADHDWDQYPSARHLSISEVRRILREERRPSQHSGTGEPAGGPD